MWLLRPSIHVTTNFSFRPIRIKTASQQMLLWCTINEEYCKGSFDSPSWASPTLPTARVVAPRCVCWQSSPGRRRSLVTSRRTTSVACRYRAHPAAAAAATTRPCRLDRAWRPGEAAESCETQIRYNCYTTNTVWVHNGHHPASAIRKWCISKI